MITIQEELDLTIHITLTKKIGFHMPEVILRLRMIIIIIFQPLTQIIMKLTAQMLPTATI